MRLYALPRRPRQDLADDGTGIPMIWVALGTLLFGLIMLGTLAFLSWKNGWKGPEKEHAPAEQMR